MAQNVWLWPTCSSYGWYICVLALKVYSTEPAELQMAFVFRIWTPDLWFRMSKQSKSFLCGQEGPLHPDRAAHLKCSSSQLVISGRIWSTSMCCIKHVVLIVGVANGEVLWLWPPMRKFLSWSKCRSLGLCLIGYVDQLCLPNIINMFIYAERDMPMILSVD